MLSDLSKFTEERTLLVLTAPDLETAIRNVLSDFLAKQEEQKEEALVRRNEVNKRLHVDNSTLWRWDRDGYLKAIRIGRSVFYRESDVKRLEEGRV